MSLASLHTRKQLNVLGLNSGTSADGLDLALVRIGRQGQAVRYAYIKGAHRKFSSDLRNEILEIASAETLRPERLMGLDQALGTKIGREAASFIRRLSKAGHKVDLVASHGQTVRHLPQYWEVAGIKVRGTLQLGNLAQVAAVTGRPVVGDFRQADVAAGSEGAPITTEAIARLFRHKSETRVIVNIGGIANYFWLPAHQSRQAIRAADCGPGNSLCDILARRLLGEQYDKGGRHALSGRPSIRLLSLLHAHPFFLAKRKSTGREDFGEAMVERIVEFGRHKKLCPEDLLASAAELTASAIASRVGPLLNEHQGDVSLYLTGGGSRNRFFVRRIRELLVGYAVKSIKELEFDPSLVEAVSYAVLAELCLRGESVSGSDPRNQKRPVLGQIVQPPQAR